MGGRFYEHELFDLGKWGVVEWNIKCDPFAVKIVFNSDVKDFYIAGIEQTCKFRKDAPEVAEKIQHLSWMKPVSDAIRDKDDTWFHDAVAIWAMLYQKMLHGKKETFLWIWMTSIWVKQVFRKTKTENIWCLQI